MDNSSLNQLLKEEKELSNIIGLKYNYPSNITHLLYLIIPAFIIKYKPTNRKLIEDCFTNIKIVISDKQDKINQAFYFSKPYYDENNNIKTAKGIVLKNYQDIDLMSLLDNLVHEYNHAVNSYLNEIEVNDNVLIRTGISYNIYNKKDLSFIKKNDYEIFEEVINTKQTESLIDIINSYNNYEIVDREITNTLYSINNSIDKNYKSSGYYVESYALKELMNNKTFVSTFEVLRLNGDVSSLSSFFDSITGLNNSFNKLALLLNKSLSLSKEISNTKWFKKYKINKLKSIIKEEMLIVSLFNNNSVYK